MPLPVVHVPTESAEKRVDVVHAGLMFVVIVAFIFFNVFAKPLYEMCYFAICLFFGGVHVWMMNTASNLMGFGEGAGVGLGIGRAGYEKRRFWERQALSLPQAISGVGLLLHYPIVSLIVHRPVWSNARISQNRFSPLFCPIMRMYSVSTFSE